MVQDDEPVGLDGLRVEFDDERVVSDAGIALVATLAERLGIEGSGRSIGGAASRSSRRGERGPEGDGADLRDAARCRLHR